MSGRQIGKREIYSFWIHEPLLACGVAVGDLQLAGDAAIVMLLRGEELMPASDELRLQPDDHVFILCSTSELPMITLLFGRQED